MYIDGFKEGEPYTSLTRCIAINLISQGFKLNSEVHSAYAILEQKSYQPLTDLLTGDTFSQLISSKRN